MNKFIGYGRHTLICEHCGKETTRNSNRQKYCPDCKVIVERQKALDRYYAREKDEIYKAERAIYYAEYRAGERRGYNQSGVNNNNWRGGASSVYYDKFMKRTCERCGASTNLLVHHRDRNRHNNSLDNLETLCKRCHQIEHRCWENFTKGIVRSAENEESVE